MAFSALLSSPASTHFYCIYFPNGTESHWVFSLASSVLSFSTPFSSRTHAHTYTWRLSNECRLDVIMLIFNICKLTLNILSYSQVNRSEVFPSATRFFQWALSLSLTLSYSFQFKSFLTFFPIYLSLCIGFFSPAYKRCVAFATSTILPEHERANSSNVIPISDHVGSN